LFLQFSASIHIHPPKIPVINQDINKDYKPKQKPGNVVKYCFKTWRHLLSFKVAFSAVL